MKTQFIKRFFLILAALICISCQSKINDDDAANKDSTIIGKWKLDKIVPFTNLESYDYSQYNIVFEFKTNGTLTVSGTNELANASIFPEGDYLYLLKNDFIRIKSDLFLQGKSDFWYNFSSNEGILGSISLNDNMIPDDFLTDGGVRWFFIQNK